MGSGRDLSLVSQPFLAVLLGICPAQAPFRDQSAIWAALTHVIRDACPAAPPFWDVSLYFPAFVLVPKFLLCYFNQKSAGFGVPGTVYSTNWGLSSGRKLQKQETHQHWTFLPCVNPLQFLPTFSSAGPATVVFVNVSVWVTLPLPEQSSKQRQKQISCTFFEEKNDLLCLMSRYPGSWVSLENSVRR